MPVYFFGHNATRKTVNPETLTFEEFVARLQPSVVVNASISLIDTLSKPEREKLKNGHYFCPSEFSGNQRGLDFITSINLVCLDIDDASNGVNWPAIAGLRYAWYETFSSRPHAPRYRVVVEAHDIPVTRYRDAVELLAGWLGVTLDNVSFNPVQPMYTARIFSDYTPQWGYNLNGSPMLAEWLPPVVEHPEPEPRTPSTWNDTVDSIAEMISHIDPSCNRDEWMTVCRGLRHHFEDDETGFKIFDEWSKQSPTKYNARETYYQYFSGTKPELGNGRKSVTLASINDVAKKYGYNPTAEFAAQLFGKSVQVVLPRINGHDMGEGLNIGVGWEFFHVGFPELKTNGKPKGTFVNFKHLLDRAGIVCRYNIMTKNVELSLPGAAFLEDNSSLNQLTLLTNLCIQVDFPTNHVESYTMLAADENAYHPARDWILSKPWDGQDRLGALLWSLDPEQPDLAWMLMIKWMVTAVTAIMEPDGVSSQGVLVLQGPQNAGKTTWFKMLLGSNQHFGKEGAILDPSDKDSIKQSVSYWIVELGEIDATFKRSDLNALKGFITKQRDEFRAAFAKRESRYPRKTVFFGTVNPDRFLHDTTGNRRFWTIKIGPKFNAFHGLDAQQIWRQVYDTLMQTPLNLSPEQNALLNEYNMAFEANNTESEILYSKYNPAGEKIRSLTVSEIIAECGYDPLRCNYLKWSVAVERFSGEPGVKIGNRTLYRMPMISLPFVGGMK